MWPDGCWSLYEINCDEIAKRIGFQADGTVVRRDPWPGFIGCFGSIQELTDAITKAIST